jgi:hypothetical protein
MCKACYEPQWSDALRDWEYVESPAGPCGACRELPMDVARMPVLVDAVAPGAGTGEGS